MSARTWWPRLAAMLLVVLATGLVACGDDDDGSEGEGEQAKRTRLQLNGADKPNVADFPRPQRGQTLQQFADSIGAIGTQIGLASSIFTVGENRVAFGLRSEERAFVYAPTAVYVSRGPASKRILGPYPAPADLLVTEPAFRSRQAATEEDPFAAIYEARGVRLGGPGQWQVVTVSNVQGQLVAAATPILVRRDAPIPDVGEPAPAVDTDTAAESPNLEAIDTRIPPARELHEESFKDVVGEKPVALLFATPQLCQSSVCGPVVDIALQLRQRYGDEVEFIHQEVYVDNEIEKGMREPLKRFNLPTEPWLFTVGRDGRIAARLEGSFGLKAFERAIQAALG
jgi:hypothetical protein